jgi:ribosomal protein L33
MFNVSAAGLWHKSKRIVVKLLSAAQTGFYYVTEKSPSKRDVRMALRKHDPIVNQHVIFYEQKNLSSSQAQKLMRKRSIRNMRFTGKRVEQLVKQEERRSNRSIGIL